MRVIRSLLHRRPFLYLDQLWWKAAECLYRMVPQGDPRIDSAKHSIVICTVGQGNVGDQAMLDGYLHAAKNRCATLITSSRQALSVDAHFAPRARTICLPGVFQGRPRLSPRNVLRFARLLRTADQLDIIGADILDGSYSPRESRTRAQAAELASYWNIPVRVLGFSWSECPDRSCKDAWQALQDRVELKTRDSLSLQRLAKDGIQNVELTADIAFALWGKPVSAVNSPVRPYFLVNVSGLAEAGPHETFEYHYLLRAARDLGIHAVVLPHVRRRGDDDLAASRTVLKGIDNYTEVQAQLSPSQVRGWAAHAQFVVTGRMHLAVLAMTVGTPTWALESHDKVRGMLLHFGLGDFAVDRSANFGRLIIDALSDGPALRAAQTALQERIPEIARLAESQVA